MTAPRSENRGSLTHVGGPLFLGLLMGCAHGPAPEPSVAEPEPAVTESSPVATVSIPAPAETRFILPAPRVGVALEAHFHAGEIHMRTRNFADAERHYRRIVQLSPSSYDGWLALGTALVWLHRVEDARAAYEFAMRLDEWRPEAHYNMGLLEWRHAQPTGFEGPHRTTRAGEDALSGVPPPGR